MSGAITGADNIALLARVKEGDKAAEEEIIQNNVGLVHSTLKHFRTSNYEYDDLFQAGCIGLLKAARSFDETKGNLFSTYAVCVVSGEIKRYIRDNTSLKMSRQLREIFMRANRARNKLSGSLGREPTISEISRETGDDSEDIVLALEANSAPLSFDEKVGGDGDDAEFGELYGVDETDKVDEVLSLKLAVDKLPDFEKQLIMLRYFRNKTQSETAKILKVSQVQISRKEKRILEDLRDKMA